MTTSTWKTLPEYIRNTMTALLATAGLRAENLLVESDDASDTQRKTLTKREASRIAGVSIDTINRRIKDGSLRAKKIHPGRSGAVRIFRDSFDRWLNDGQPDGADSKR